MLSDTSLSCSSKTIEPSINGNKSLSIYNSLVPYIDSDNNGSDAESSSLSGEDNTIPTMGKTKHSTDQKVPDKKPLVLRPKEDFSKEAPFKKCLVLKPHDDESPINEKEKEILPIKKCLVLKPKNDEPIKIKTEPESTKKCLVRLPKVDCESNSSKLLSSNEEKDLEKKNRRRENGNSDSDNNKTKFRFDHNNHNGLVLYYCEFYKVKYFNKYCFCVLIK